MHLYIYEHVNIVTIRQCVNVKTLRIANCINISLLPSQFYYDFDQRSILYENANLKRFFKV